MADVKRCKVAMQAAMRLINEECGDAGVYKTVGDGVMVYLPKSAMEDIQKATGKRFGEPLTDSERQKAVEACMRGEWANHWVNSIAPDASPEVKNMLKRKLCESLVD